MDTTVLASLSLFAATPNQILESRRRAAVHWGRGLLLEEYLAREEFISKQELACDGRLITWVLAPRSDPTSLDFLCSCRTFRRDGLVCSQNDAKPKEIVYYGISAAFTPPHFRGKGYASHMMRLLHWVIADESLLPTVFPTEWGAPPPRVMHAGDGQFSVLWSDVGAELYKRCGPTKDSVGWVVRSPFSTTWDVKQKSPSTDTIGWTLLDESDVVKLWEEDAENISRTLSPADNFKVSFSCLPNKGVAALQYWRRIDFLDKCGYTPIQHWGIIGESNTFATWTFEIMSPPKTLLITRLSSSSADFENLLGMVMSVARKHGMERVEVYNLPDHLQSSATRLGGITAERDEHLSSFKWYGKEDPSEVAWLLNESDHGFESEDTGTELFLNPNMPPQPAKEHPLNYRSKWPFCALFIPVVLFVFSLLRVDRRVEAGVKNVEFDIHLHHQDDGAMYTSLNVSAPVIPAFSLTAILPVTRDSLSGLEEALKSLLGPSQLREIILLCPYAIMFQTRSVVRETVSSYPDIPDIRLQAVQTDIDARVSGIHAATQLSGWVLILDQDGLAGQNSHSRGILLQPPALSFPYGPKGICFSWFNTLEPCMRRSVGFPQEAHHLLPPFVMPAALATENGIAFPIVDPWSGLGEYIATSRTDGIGGVVFGTGTDMIAQAIDLEQVMHEHSSGTLGPSNNGSVQGTQLGDSTLAAAVGYSAPGVFVVILPTFEDFRHLSALMCMLKNTGGHLINIWIYGAAEATLDIPDPQDGRLVVSEDCTLHYATLTLSEATIRVQQLSAWFQSLATPADVILSLREDKLTSLATEPFRQGSVSVQLFRDDLPHTEWMGSLSLSEWKNWNQPQIDISIITNNRPLSLTRLLKSLTEAHFYGDTVNLRMNVEQSADDETLKIVQNIDWPHGTVFVHHRIVQGGLMPAVVESWYPRSNDTYGLLLEDDVELSPLFYAWAKMSLLRYRYGDPRNRSPLMFGISLYQQKNVELPPEGRRPFDARALFSSHRISDPTTPYLSPIPCSWGAIYFPEHWRDFHSYLPLRLSGSPFKLNEVIIPNVRSNKWSKSWKKYFIELVYLRGYVMLYPNYPDFVSLSTNHLEVGSHVKVRTPEKQKQFLVPLMETTNCGTVGLLDLPGRTLPQWDALPVLNLTGDMATLESLAEVGHVRREELTGCTDYPALFDIRQLLCTAPRL